MHSSSASLLSMFVTKTSIEIETDPLISVSCSLQVLLIATVDAFQPCVNLSPVRVARLLCSSSAGCQVLPALIVHERECICLCKLV